MPKRKRDGTISQEGQEGQTLHTADKAARSRTSRFRGQFENGVELLTAQIKLARAFDRQKMSRRMKDAGSDTAKSSRLEAELVVLKGLNANTVSFNYLLKQCVKTKKIRECSAFVTNFGANAESRTKGPANPAEANVLGRLFKSKPVGDILPKIMQDIRTVLEVDGDGVTDSYNSATTNGHAGVSAPEDGEEFDGFSDASIGGEEIAELEEGNGEALDQDESRLEAYEARLAASSDSDSDSEGENERGNSMSVTSEEEEEEEEHDLDYPSRDKDDISLTPQSDLDEIHKPKHTMKSSRDSTHSERQSKMPALPSLMHGGYYSGSDSASDFDPDKDEQVAAMAKPRKNRRGQQARRAIAEKKHGEKAKHLQKMNGKRVSTSGTGRTGSERENRWDPRRGAVYRARNGRNSSQSTVTNRFSQSNAGIQHNERGLRQLNGSDVKRVDKKATTKGPDKPLHPSWEAARKKKLVTAAGNVGFAGKKITFD